MRRDNGSVQRRQCATTAMAGRVKKPLHRAVVSHAPAGGIAHGDVVRRTKRTGNDVA
jgi:hypothetical protein